MDLLARFRLCLQCLPIFSSDPPRLPPPPSKAVATHTTSVNNACSTSTKNPSEKEDEKPSFSDASLAHDHQHQGLPISHYAKEVDSPVFAPTEPKPGAKGDELCADHGAHQQLQAPDDVEFMTSGVPSPASPTPIGLGYVVGEHTPPHHATHQVDPQHKDHSFFHIHTHGKTPPLHLVSESSSNTLSSSQPEGERGKEDMHHMTSLPLEVSHSTPANIELTSGPHGENDNSDEDSVMGESSSTLKSSESEPINGIGTVRVRRRDQLKHQLKDLRNQLKQGRNLLKEEGAKHLQNMVTTISKQAQQIEESGSFFMVPRIHDAS